MKRLCLKIFISIFLVGAFFSSSFAFEVKYATGFSFEKSGDCRIITVKVPYHGATAPLKYILVPYDAVEVPEIKGAVKISVPIKRTIVGTTPVIACMESLGILDRLVGLAGGKYIYTKAVTFMNLPEVAGDGGMSRSLDRERILKIAPDAFISYLYGEEEFMDVRFLSDHGVPVVLVSEYLEETPLGRAEWIKFIGAFFCMEDKASLIFDQVEINYRRLVDEAESVKVRPSAIMGSPFKGTWYVAKSDSWPVKFIESSGGRYLWDDLPGSGTLPMDVEAVLERGADSDLWLNCGMWHSLSDAEKSGLPVNAFRSFREKKIFNNDRRVNENGGNDFYQTGVIRPDLVLRDLIRIMHPELESGHELFFYRRLQ